MLALGHVNEFRLRVTYADTDQMGVVYYANYLKYFEIGRTEYVRDLGATYKALEEEGVFLAVSEAYCRFRAPARYDELVTVRTWVSRLRPTRIDFSHEVVGESGALLTQGKTILACLGRDRKPMPLPPRLREGLREQAPSS